MLLISFAVVIFISAKVEAGQGVIPLHYDITITPNIHNLSFFGETTVQVHVEEIVRNITINYKNLEFSKFRVFDSNSLEITEKYVLLNEVTETITLRFMNQLNEGLYDLKFTYTGKINEKHEGLYKSQYTNQAGVERPFLLTNFQFSHARQVFPCFDHPSLPATYSINIVRRNDYISLSNTPKASEEKFGDGQTIDKFARSDTMPTYLVSFVVIDFATLVNGTISVFSLEQHGTELAVSLISEASTKFQELYPVKLNKIDYVIVPDYALSEIFFASIGLTLFRQSAVFFNKETNRTEDQQSILKSIAYTIVKQTNKNEDTSDWWTHFWLNEGILRWYQYEICNALRPEWRLLEQFIVQDLHETLYYDKNEGGIEVTVKENNSPNDLSKHFNVKSFSLIRMFKHQQLPGDITEISENDFVKSWANYKGYPILSTRRNFETNVITASQNSAKPIISIPFSATTQEIRDFDTAESIYTLKKHEEQFDISLRDSDSWYIINKQQTGYFRVNYFDEDWWQINKFLQNADHTTISAINRAELIDDAYNLAFDEVISDHIFLDTIRYIAKEEDLLPLYTFFKTTTRLKILLAGSETYSRFLSHVTLLAEHLYEKVGTEVLSNDSYIARLNRINVLTWLCNFDYKPCQQQMYNILSKRENVHPDLQEPVYCGGMRLSNIENFQYLLTKYQESKNTNILKYMGCTSDETVLRYYLEGILNETIIVHLRPEHALDAFAAVIEGSHQGAKMALVFIKQYLENILQRFDEDIISKLFIILSSRLVDPENSVVIDEMIECLTGYDQTKYSQLLRNAKSNIEKNINWKSKHLTYISDWLYNNGTTTSTTTTTSTSKTTQPTESPDGAATLTTDLLCILVFALTYFTLFYNN